MDILLTITATSLAVMLAVFVCLRKCGATGVYFFVFGSLFTLLSTLAVLAGNTLPPGIGELIAAVTVTAACLTIFFGMRTFLGLSSPSIPMLAASILVFAGIAALLEASGAEIAPAEMGAGAACTLLAATGATLFLHWPRRSAITPYLLFCITLFFAAALLNGTALAVMLAGKIGLVAESGIRNQGLPGVGLLGMPVVFLGLILMLHGWMIAGLRKQVAHDDLTGTYARRAFLERAETLHSVMARLGRPMAFLLLDIDRFKQINDLYGHAGGDRALSHFTRVVETCLAGRGIIGRLGGEEFGIAVRVEGRLEVAELADEICRTIRSTPAILENGTRIALTVSIGVTLAERNRSLSEIMAEADTALYEAKAAGRDRFCMADSFPGSVLASARALAGAAAQLRQAADDIADARTLSGTG